VAADVAGRFAVDFEGELWARALPNPTAIMRTAAHEMRIVWLDTAASSARLDLELESEAKPCAKGGPRSFDCQSASIRAVSGVCE
jgi:hypothetical protein